MDPNAPSLSSSDVDFLRNLITRLGPTMLSSTSPHSASPSAPNVTSSSSNTAGPIASQTHAHPIPSVSTSISQFTRSFAGGPGSLAPGTVASQVSHGGGIASPIAPYTSMSMRSAGGVQRTPHGHTGISAAGGLNFQGIQSLGNGVTRQIVNQQRRASAAATLPHPAALQPRQSRRRGSANPPPGLATSQSVRNCIMPHPFGGSPTIKIRAKVYAPTEDTQQELVIYQEYQHSFNTYLQDNFLFWEYDLGIETTLGHVINSIAEDMRNCPLAYQFGSRYPQGIVRNEALPLRLLALVNRGRIRPSDNQVHLQRLAIDASTSLSDLASNINYYANPRLCIEEGRFVLHFLVSQFPLSAVLSAPGSGPARRHRCVSSRFYQRFPSDGYIDGGESDGYSSSGGELSGGEEDSNTPMDTTEDSVPVRHNARQLTSQVTTQRHERTIPQNVVPSTQLQPARVVAQPQNVAWALPASIWDSAWTPPRLANPIENLTTVDEIDTYVSAHASARDSPRFSLEGNSVTDLALKFCKEVSKAASRRDFSNILTREREFVVTNNNNSIRSIGAGIEAEVLHTAFSQLLHNPGEWFYPRVDNTCSFAIMHSSLSSIHSSPARLNGMHVFGALSALLLVRGIAPTPLSPLVLLWIIHDFDLAVLHSDLVAEWHPQLHDTVKRWLELGPTDSIASFQPHFSTWHDQQVSVYSTRDTASHKAIAAEMLYRAIIGTESPEHPEIQAFVQGFRLTCQNGFDFIKLIRSFQGGAELYLSLVWTTQIKSFEDLRGILNFRQTHPTIVHSAFSLFADQSISLQSLITSFLQEAGIPCPNLFRDAIPHFSDGIDLSKVDKPWFRSRMFCWAATGATSIPAETGNISIHLVGDQNFAYGNPATQAVMIENGKISFRTCSRAVRIPASYIAKLASAQYVEGQEPASLEKALHHWLLVEVLNAIGGHSML